MKFGTDLDIDEYIDIGALIVFTFVIPPLNNFMIHNIT